MSESYVSLRQIIRKNDAVLRVLAPTGSIVTAVKGSIVKTVPSNRAFINNDDINFASYYFMFTYEEYGEWTVTSTLNNESTNDLVIINTNKEYSLILLYKKYIYNIGDICENVSGGWTGYRNFSFTSNYINIPLSSGGDNADIFTQGQVDVTDFNFLVFEWEGKIYSGTGGTQIQMWIANHQLLRAGVSGGTGATIEYKIGDGVGAIILSTYTLDISTLSGTYFIGCHAGRGGGSGDGWDYAHLLKIYLRK